MGNDCGAEFLSPVHHRTFQLSREPFDEPIERFLAAAGRLTVLGNAPARSRSRLGHPREIDATVTEPRP